MNWSKLSHLTDRASLHPDLNRAFRATVAFMVPLLLATTGRISFDMSFVAIAAQNIAMVDVRGDYRLRLALLLAMTAVFAGAAAIGATVANNLLVAVLATGLMAVAGGVWRHLSSDYGPSLAISSTLVFLIALAARGGPASVGTHALAAFVGGIWGVMVQVAQWPFRPQHAIRRTVADSWLAVAELCDALAPVPLAGAPARRDRILENEAAVRAALDRTYATLEAARAGEVRRILEALNLAAARMATRVVALNTAIDAAVSTDAAASLEPALESVLTSLANVSRSAALTVVSRQPGHLTTFEVRVRQVRAMLGLLRTRVSHDLKHTQLAEIVRQIDVMLTEAERALRATIERAEERAATSLELPDLRTLALRPLASALNLSLHIDPALVRFTLRLAALTMAGTLAFKLYGIPHGYWLPFTVVVVLQPDYGSTRQRATQRVLGTLAGSVLASAILWLHPPAFVLLAATTVTMFAFGYFVKRNYAVAIFFVTLFIVFITEAAQPVTIAFTIERLASTLAGGALALLAAYLFWPVWERDRLPGILAHTFRANAEYLTLLVSRLSTGGTMDGEVTLAKRRAESANSAAFSSLRRLSGDPMNRQEGLENAATLVNGNQRLTRTLNVLTLHLSPDAPLKNEALLPFAALARDALERLAKDVEHGAATPTETETLLLALEQSRFDPNTGTERERWIFAQLNRAALELSTLLLALQSAATSAPHEPAISAAT